MARPDKAAAVAELADEFRSSHGAVLTEYRGLTVKQLQDLRRALGDNASYAVVKNTLTKIAAREAGVEGFDDLLVGPSAIAFITGDAVETAKSLRDFARTNSPLVIKGGILDGAPAHGRGDRQDRRPGVPRGAAGPARRRAVGVPEERRLPVQRAARRRSRGWPGRFRRRRSRTPRSSGPMRPSTPRLRPTMRYLTRPPTRRQRSRPPTRRQRSSLPTRPQRSRPLPRRQRSRPLTRRLPGTPPEADASAQTDHHPPPGRPTSGRPATRKEAPPWRRSAPAISSTRSRR